MNRRAFVSGLGAVLAAPLGAGAQQAATSPRIGVLTLSFSSQVSGVITPIGPGGPRDSSLREGVKDSGYVQNVAVEYRYAENDVNRLPQLALQLLEERVSVMVAVGPAALKPRTPCRPRSQSSRSTLKAIQLHPGTWRV
jgi:hypothetical protein